MLSKVIRYFEYYSKMEEKVLNCGVILREKVRIYYICLIFQQIIEKENVKIFIVFFEEDLKCFDVVDDCIIIKIDKVNQ